MKAMMKNLTKVVLAGMMMLCGTVTMSAQDNVIGAIDTTYIKLDINLEPVSFVGMTVEDLRATVGELETILETEAFQLYGAGDYTYRVENDMVVSQTIQIPDATDDKVVYNQILNALAKSSSIRDTHNTGGHLYQYANFQIQFDDFQGYEKLTFQVNPDDE